MAKMKQNDQLRNTLEYDPEFYIKFHMTFMRSLSVTVDIIIENPDERKRNFIFSRSSIKKLASEVTLLSNQIRKTHYWKWFLRATVFGTTR